LSRKNLFI